MNDRNDQIGNESADDTLSSIAREALRETEASVDVAGALSSVRHRAATTTEAHEYSSVVRPSRWLILGAAAVVIAMVAAGLVAGLRGDDGGSVRTNTVPPVSDVAPVLTVTESSVVATTAPVVAAPTTVPQAPATTVAQSDGGQVIAVDAANPPQLLDPQPFATLPLEPNPNGNSISVAIATNAVLVKQPGVSFVSVVSNNGNSRQVELEEQISSMVAGPGNVLYGLGDVAIEEGAALGPIRFVVIPFALEREGEVVAVAELGWVQYVELGPGAFGHGPDGIIDRARDVNATVLSYVDVSGEPTEWTGDDLPLLTMGGENGVVSVVGADLAWTLDIARSPSNGGAYVGPSPPAPTTGGRVIYSEAIGPNATPDQDFGPNEMPVVAILEPDGSGRWVRLPDEWSVAASDVWGTVLVRTSNGVVELAMLDDALERFVPEPQPDPEPIEGALAITSQCVEEFNCTQLASMNDGRIVAYDPVDDTLTVLDPLGETIQDVIQLAEPLGARRPYLITVGPDDVAYFSVGPIGVGDPINDLIAIPLGGSNIGTAFRYDVRLDGSGDTDLVPTREGLANVGCCGFDPVRPSDEAQRIPWLDSAGIATLSEGPTFQLVLNNGEHMLVRTDGDGSTSFELPALATSPRGMPRVVPLDDGGAMMSIYDGGYSNRSYVIRFRGKAERDVDPWNIYLVRDVFFGDVSIVLLEPSGTAIVRIGNQFVRRTLEEVGTPGWPGRTEVDFSGDTWTRSAPGLNDYIDENRPEWAADPSTLARQLTPVIDGGERYNAHFDELSGVLSITISNLRDDSVQAFRSEYTLELGSDGLYRVVSGTYAQQCQPGRGHQAFLPEPCI